MIIKIIILFLLGAFYIIYFAKAIILKKQGITIDLLGKGDKPSKAVIAERVLKSITYIGAAIQFLSAIFPDLILSLGVPFPVRIAGVAFAAFGVIFFAVSVAVMRNNWRAGFAENQKTSLVTNGIYKFSRNPAFVGFDLLYAGCALAFPNILMIGICVMAAVAFHIQILGEEKFLASQFGQNYIDYKSEVRRYL